MNMIKIKIGIFSMFFMLSMNMLAQTLSPFVLSSAGQSASAGGVQLSWNLGETFTTSAASNKNWLTHGFEQPELQIWTDNISLPACGNGAVSIPYRATGVMDNANTFTAELSDANGNFSNALVIGSVKTAAGGVISAVIPNSLPSGSGYRIRVRSSLPQFTGMDNGADLSITNRASIPDAFALTSGTAANTVYIGYSSASSLTLTANVSGNSAGATYVWYGSNGNKVLGTNKTLVVNTPDIYTVVVSVGGCSYASSKQVVQVDLTCGKKPNTGVTVCRKYGSNFVTECVASANVSSILQGGGYLGACVVNNANTKSNNAQVSEVVINKGVFDLSAYPNPSSSQFTLQVQSDAVREKISLRVLDINGRVVEMIPGLSAQQVIRIGANYIQGIYIVEMIQGDQRKTIKLVKQ
jgi:hypothetical protein